MEMDLFNIIEKVKTDKPLIHCITSPIAINDCANLVLIAGARPIMAEHPEEVSDITAMAEGLSVSLANITDARARSVMISGNSAFLKGVPKVIDLVGITCSRLRMDIADRFIKECRPEVIKGNVSEIRALLGLAHDTSGVDTGPMDKITAGDDPGARKLLLAMRDFSEKTGSVLLATGEVDMATDGKTMWRIDNGSPSMSYVTGTGCMMSCLIAAMLYGGGPLEAVLFSSSVFGIAGELADDSQGLGSFHIHLLDEMSLMTRDKFEKHSRISKVI